MYKFKFTDYPKHESELEMVKTFQQKLKLILAAKGMDAETIDGFLTSLKSSTFVTETNINEIIKCIENLNTKDCRIIMSNMYKKYLSTIDSSNIFNLQLNSEKQQKSLSIKAIKGNSKESRSIYIFNENVKKTAESIKRKLINDDKTSKNDNDNNDDDDDNDVMDNTRKKFEKKIEIKNKINQKLIEEAISIETDDLIVGNVYIPRHDNKSLYKLIHIENISNDLFNSLLAKETFTIFKILNFTGTVYTLDAYVDNETNCEKNFKNCKLTTIENNVPVLPYFIVSNSIKTKINFYQSGVSALFNINVKRTSSTFEFMGIVSEHFLKTFMHKILYFKIYMIQEYKSFKFYYVTIYMKNKDTHFFYTKAMEGMEKSFLDYGNLHNQFKIENEIDKLWSLRKAFYLYYQTNNKFVTDLFPLIEKQIIEMQQQQQQQQPTVNEIMKLPIIQAIVLNRCVDEYINYTTKITPFIENELLAIKYSGMQLTAITSVYSKIIKPILEKEKINKSTLNISNKIDTCASGPLNSLVSVWSISNMTNDKVITESSTVCPEKSKNIKKFCVDSNAIASVINTPLYKGSEDILNNVLF